MLIDLVDFDVDSVLQSIEGLGLVTLCKALHTLLTSGQTSSFPSPSFAGTVRESKN